MKERGRERERHEVLAKAIPSALGVKAKSDTAQLKQQ